MKSFIRQAEIFRIIYFKWNCNLGFPSLKIKYTYHIENYTDTNFNWALYHAAVSLYTKKPTDRKSHMNRNQTSSLIVLTYCYCTGFITPGVSLISIKRPKKFNKTLKAYLLVRPYSTTHWSSSMKTLFNINCEPYAVYTLNKNNKKTLSHPFKTIPMTCFKINILDNSLVLRTTEDDLQGL